MRGKGISRAQSKGKLVGRRWWNDKGSTRGEPGAPLISEKQRARPWGLEEILPRRPGPIGEEPAAGMIDRQRRQPGDGRARRLSRRDAEIGTDGGRRLHRQTRAGRKAPLSGRNHGVKKQVASHTLFAAEALAQFAMQAQPLHRPIFGEGACLHGKIDITQAVERRIAGGFALPNDLYGWAELELTKVDNGKSETVAWPEIIRRCS